VIFNRFAKEARRSVEAALQEARMLGHDFLGDEDLLLGILRADEGIAAEALSSLGVTLEDARSESEAMFSGALASIGISLEGIRREAGDAFDMRVPEKRRIPFAPGAKKVLERAVRTSVRLGVNYLGTEHILLAILENEDGTAVRILARLGVAPEMLEDRLFDARSG
jgi:ATP-dependent Clp protease ATP-binding subunit ClpC